MSCGRRAAVGLLILVTASAQALNTHTEEYEGRCITKLSRLVLYRKSEGGTSSTAVINTGEESFFDLQRRIARLADQAARKEYEDRARMNDLEQQVTVARERAVGAEQRAHAAEQKAAGSDAAKAELEAKLLEDIAQHNQQVADYEVQLKRSKTECLEQSLLTQEAWAEAVHMRQNYAVLNRRLVQAVEQSGRVSTLAHVRIAELSAEVVDGLNIVHQMGQRAQDFMQGIMAGRHLLRAKHRRPVPHVVCYAPRRRASPR
ncbi:uncharacterized protein TRAVEDRAFT_24787 [Trametes versicolor FP-101664 SS1]|uniref:Uncharacterized protein n=1 Tax=Trametes versicolor (strain FP-101664) TaxID=717944 RepID=R7SB22_TRAVS|nr:uncharacterized protein TRAVEDRAFT_24787 [Trametes versicolor FP-101664 SS1]EIW52114.1 hypothetical protein TRAVEDRAFT_24787 [Trametes versicolor FP-101664 SS1]